MRVVGLRVFFYVLDVLDALINNFVWIHINLVLLNEPCHILSNSLLLLHLLFIDLHVILHQVCILCHFLLPSQLIADLTVVEYKRIVFKQILHSIDMPGQPLILH